MCLVFLPDSWLVEPGQCNQLRNVSLIDPGSITCMFFNIQRLPGLARLQTRDSKKLHVVRESKRN